MDPEKIHEPHGEAPAVMGPPLAHSPAGDRPNVLFPSISSGTGDSKATPHGPEHWVWTTRDQAGRARHRASGKGTTGAGIEIAISRGFPEEYMQLLGRKAMQYAPSFSDRYSHDFPTALAMDSADMV